MKGYSVGQIEDCAYARVEGVNASYRDLGAVCASIMNLDSEIAANYLALVQEGLVPVYFGKHNKKMGHRRELGGKKGRYPQKAAGIVLKLLKSAVANASVKGITGTFVISAMANKKDVYPRMSSKGRLVRSNLETARVEIVLGSTSLSSEKTTKETTKGNKKGEAVEKGKKSDKSSEKKETSKNEKTEAKDPHDNIKIEQKTSEHKHEMEKITEHEKKHEDSKPHHHGEYKKDTKNR